MPKEKVNYQEVYDLYQLCSETKELKEFCNEMGVNYEKFMNWQRHQLWDEKMGKTVSVEQPSTAPVRIVGTPSNQPTVKMEQVKPAKPEPIKWVKLQLRDGAFMFSVTESCWLNDINPVNYLEMIFTKIRDGEAVTQALLPCYYKEKC